jgi:hypothetical protein
MKKIDGFDDCIVGVVSRTNMVSLLCYEENKIISKLIREHHMSWEDAHEHYNYNIRGAYVGQDTPCFLTEFTTDE